ncbi:MAG: methionine--tRNA ligase [Acidimicrobiales bacterium]|nr:methionine--tRNA ligase [Acidimicrobiales bacterium]
MSRFYMTTPIYYVNDAPHIGHAYTTLNGDAVTRWHRLLGDEVMYLTGTDEHGLKVARAAEKNGLTPREQADRTSERFREAWAELDVANDDFIRTTEERHYRSVQQFLQTAYDNGHIYRDTYEGWYSVSDEAYVTQADVDAGTAGQVEWMREDNYFFRLSDFQDRLLEWYERVPDNVTPEGYRKEALGIIRQGLTDLSISRTSIDWGIPVPWDPDHVFYVWYDALINYATGVGYGSDPDRFAQWWPHCHHLIGKDIIRFHCVYWPAMLMAAGIEELPKLHVHGWLLVGGEKMSKSKLNQIAPADLITDFGVDGFRYAMLRDNPFGPDSDFSYEALQVRYNSDLANAFGNLLQRVSTIVTRSCGGIGPAPSPDSPLAATAAAVYADAAAAWDRVQASVALDATWRLVREANEYLQEREPWKLEPGAELDTVMGDALEVVRIVSILASPAIPNAAAEAWRRLGLDGSPLDQRLPEAAAWGGYPGGCTVELGEPLFPRLKG